MTVELAMACASVLALEGCSCPRRLEYVLLLGWMLGAHNKKALLLNLALSHRLVAAISN